MTDSPAELTRLAPFPAALSLPENYPRHDPDREAARQAVTGLIGEADWVSLCWADLVDRLIALGRTDVPLSRLAEGHLDALRICDQAGAMVVPNALYGVWASRSQASGVRAFRRGNQLVLDGTIRFASGAGIIDRALVPVWCDDGSHLLVDLDATTLPIDRTGWMTGAMQVSQSHAVAVEDRPVAADDQVGADNFYLSRPQFFPGGVGVAAVWVGNAARVVDALRGWLGPGPSGPAKDLRLGRIRTGLAVGAALVRSAGTRLDDLLPLGASIDASPAEQRLMHELATEARAGVGDAVGRLLGEVRCVAGPAGLAYDAALTHAVDDLALYVLQQNADGDQAFLGSTWWSRGS